MATVTQPNIMQRAKIALSVFRSGYPRGVKQAPFMWPVFREGKPQWQITDFNSYVTDGFQMNTLIYEAIMYKVRATWYTPLRAYLGSEDHPEVLPLDHPLAALCHRPNKYQSTAQFMGSNTVYLNVAGNSYVMLDRPKANALPTAMYPLRPDRVWIIPGDRAIKGYFYVPEGRSQNDGVPILPQDIIHVKLPSPGDPLEGMGYGLSPFAAMSRSADVDNAITNYLKIFFQRGAAPNVYLKFDVPMDDSTIAQVKHRFMEIYGGYEKWADVGVVDQGGEIKSFGQSFKDMAFPSLDFRNESRITGPFGVPLTVLNTLAGMSAATYSNKETDRRIFWEDTMLPELGLHEADYQFYLRADDGAFVAFDTRQIPALKKDKAALSTAFANLVQVGITKNTAAAYLDMDLGKIHDGDVIYLPLNLIPMGAVKPVTTPISEGQVINESEVPDATNPDNTSGKARQNGNLKIADLIAEAKDLAISALKSDVPTTPQIDLHVHLPDQPAPIVNVYNTNDVQPAEIPAAPNVYVTNDVQPAAVQNQNVIDIPAPVVNVTNDVLPTPITVENKVDVQPTPIVNNMELPISEERTTEIERDASGDMTRTKTKITRQ